MRQRHDFFVTLRKISKNSMTLHIFNPEHDIALASNLANFTAPHAGRQLRHDLGFIPALWAKEGDKVLIDDAEQAKMMFAQLNHHLKRMKTLGLASPNIDFVTRKDMVCDGEISPWGWDCAICASLKRMGVGEQRLPSDSQLEEIRLLSHRRVAARILPSLRQEGTVGEAFECTSAEQVDDLLSRYGRLVMKAPWSSSGRGLRFLDIERTPLTMQAGWLKNLLQAQGSVMVEPFYNKVKDFGMEFTALPDGSIHYEGLSLFHTANGAYTGNVLATENVKREMLKRYVPDSLLDSVKLNICNLLSPVLSGKYVGPFGVDMMIVSTHSDTDQPADGFLLHPCVEINLRRTMGHVALALAPTDDDLQGVMRIVYQENCYRLKIEQLRQSVNLV